MTKRAFAKGRLAARLLQVTCLAFAGPAET
jgi:hypothetical protein